MGQEIKIELNHQIFQQLKELCKSDENAMKEYIEEALKIKLNQDGPSDKGNLESYLSKEPSGSKNYGVKGQGW